MHSFSKEATLSMQVKTLPCVRGAYDPNKYTASHSITIDVDGDGVLITFVLGTYA